MSLGIHSGNNVGKLSVDSAADNSKSAGAEKIKPDDSGKFSKAIDDQANAQRGSSDIDGHVSQIVSEQFLLPDNSKGANSADDGSSVTHASSDLEFIEDLIEHDASSGADLAGDNVADTWSGGEIRGFFSTENFGQIVAGSFSVVETPETEQSSNLEQSGVAAADVVTQTTESESGSSDGDIQEAAGVAASDSDELEQTGIVEIDDEPPKPSGTFSAGRDAIAAFLSGGANEGGDYVPASGFID